MALTLEFEHQNSSRYAVDGCCAIGVLKHLYYDNSELTAVSKGTREKLIAEMSQFINGAVDVADKKAKSILLATVNDHQLVAEKLLQEAGFTSAHPDWAYRNPKTYGGNSRGVKVYTKLVFTQTAIVEDEEE